MKTSIFLTIKKLERNVMMRRLIGNLIAKFRKEKILLAARMLNLDPTGDFITRDDMTFYVVIRDDEVYFIK